MALEYYFKDYYEIGMTELKNDILFEKIDKESYKDLIEFAWELGSKTAKELMQKYNTHISSDIAEKLGIPIEEKLKGMDNVDYRVFSEFYTGRKVIILYKQNIMNEFKMLNEKGITNVNDFDKIREIFIAHEIFHYLEFNEIGLTSKKKKVTTLCIGPIKLHSGIRALSEIGAHGFSKVFFEQAIND